MRKWMRNAKESWTKKTWRKQAKESYFIKGGPDKGKPDGGWKLFSGKYYSRNNFSVRNDKVATTKRFWKSRDYSIRTKKEGKFTTIYVRPNFERKKKRK